VKVRTLKDWTQELVDEICGVAGVERLGKDDHGGSERNGDLAGRRDDEDLSESVLCDWEERSVCS
jgi:hypothetical protein